MPRRSNHEFFEGIFICSNQVCTCPRQIAGHRSQRCLVSPLAFLALSVYHRGIKMGVHSSKLLDLLLPPGTSRCMKSVDSNEQTARLSQQLACLVACYSSIFLRFLSNRRRDPLKQTKGSLHRRRGLLKCGPSGPCHVLLIAAGRVLQRCVSPPQAGIKCNHISTTYRKYLRTR